MKKPGFVALGFSEKSRKKFRITPKTYYAENLSEDFSNIRVGAEIGNFGNFDERGKDYVRKFFRCSD